MKKFFYICALLAVVCAHATTTSVFFPISSMFGGNGFSGTFKIQSQAPVITDNTRIYVGTFTNVTVTPGIDPVVGLTPNNYLVTFSSAQTPWRIGVPASTNQLNALNLTVGPLPTYLYQPAGIISVSNTSSATITGDGTPTNPIAVTVIGGGSVGGFSGTATNLDGNATNQVLTLIAGNAPDFNAWYAFTNGALWSFPTGAPVDTDWYNGSYPPANAVRQFGVIFGAGLIALDDEAYPPFVCFGTVYPDVPSTQWQTWDYLPMDIIYSEGGMVIGGRHFQSLVKTTVPEGCLVVASNVTALTFTGNGSGLTNVNGGAITGTVPLIALPVGVVTNNATGLTLTGTFAGTHSGNGGGLTNINGGAITGTVPLIALPAAVLTNASPLVGTNDSRNFAFSGSWRFVNGLIYSGGVGANPGELFLADDLAGVWDSIQMLGSTFVFSTNVALLPGLNFYGGAAGLTNYAYTNLNGTPTLGTAAAQSTNVIVAQASAAATNSLGWLARSNSVPLPATVVTNASMANGGTQVILGTVGVVNGQLVLNLTNNLPTVLSNLTVYGNTYFSGTNYSTNGFVSALGFRNYNGGFAVSGTDGTITNNQGMVGTGTVKASGYSPMNGTNYIVDPFGNGLFGDAGISNGAVTIPSGSDINLMNGNIYLKANNNVDIQGGNGTFQVNNGLNINIGGANKIVFAGGDIMSSTKVIGSNGVFLVQLAAIPTNSIPAGASSITNWLKCNLNGTIYLVATNYVSGGWLYSKQSATITTTP